MNLNLDIYAVSWKVFFLQILSPVLVGFTIVLSFMLAIALEKTTGIPINPMLVLVAGLVASYYVVVHSTGRSIAKIERRIDKPPSLLVLRDLDACKALVVQAMEERRSGEQRWALYKSSVDKLQFFTTTTCSNDLYLGLWSMERVMDVTLILIVELEPYRQGATQVTMRFSSEPEGREATRGIQQRAIKRLCQMAG